MKQKEIEKLSDEKLIENIFISGVKIGKNNKTDFNVDNEEAMSQKELLKRLSRNKVEFEKNDIMLAQYFEKHIEYKEKAVEEYKKKLVGEIEKINISDYSNECNNFELGEDDITNVVLRIEDLINKIE